MGNYILQYIGDGTPDAQQAQEIIHNCQLRIIDDSLFPQTILLELAGTDIAKVRPALGTEWSLTPEKEYRVPDTRRKIKKG
ncbi:hypothetical protein L3C95_10065 [Chitinophaga filiformis]|uniref:hypothetical protein n=1 Tax=Chitinophaga filiformis TaxID=104663 RepID=UPI001F2698A8|nr:hypothetical protein [Chitinophaga filiformis]MCF6402863.1 hypothetical protein [Chitinophaga filiformis]MCF6403219.1 hypothetical protein [Chitinophaga filiformis]